MRTKSSEAVICEVGDLEAYLDGYLNEQGLSFESWIERFGLPPYSERNEVLGEFLQRRFPARVFEFACAGPFLADTLARRVASIQSYTCTNFSRRVVDYCLRYLANDHRISCCTADADLMRSPDLRHERIATYDTFITTSFEHIEHDRELVAEFPVGASFVFSVAMFDDVEHFRIYERPQDIVDRYADLLDIAEIVALQGQRLIVDSRRRA